MASVFFSVLASCAIFSPVVFAVLLAALINLLIESQCIHKIKGACSGFHAVCLAVPALQPWVLFE